VRDGAPEAEPDKLELADRLITAEQDERRRIALFLHDGPVQSLSGISLMLEAVLHAIEDGKPDEARQVLAAALERHREAIRSLRDLSFDLEPVVLRDQGFVAAVRGLAERVGISHAVRIDLDVELGERLSERAQIALFQVIREALTQAVRRGQPSRISISIAERPDGSIEAAISDDGAGERRRASLEAFEERVIPLSGSVALEQGESGGTLVQILLPPYTAR
jgi:signal transduction histidine kinase